MRADEKEKLLKEIEKTDDTEATRSMYFRVGKTAHKAITELAAISGVNKSEVVRKLVTRGLTGNDIEIAKESHTVKLDWLVRRGPIGPMRTLPRRFRFIAECVRVRYAGCFGKMSTGTID